MSHTKGPWAVCYDGRIDGQGGKFICSFRWSTYKEFNDNEEDKANARIIAAAPELLEACKEAVYAEVEPDWGMIHAAIKKAEGE